MEMKALTYDEAVALANEYQHLVGKPYLEGVTTPVLYVVAGPIDDGNREVFANNIILFEGDIQAAIAPYRNHAVGMSICTVLLIAQDLKSHMAHNAYLQTYLEYMQGGS